MPFTRTRGRPFGRTSHTFKKRLVRFSTTMANSIPTEIARIQLAETSTVVAAKIEIYAISQSAVGLDIQETNLFLFCRSDVQPLTMPDPAVTGNDPYATSPEIDSINGFHVGNLWTGDLNTSGLRFKHSISEKFRFRRKCDRNMLVVLSGDTIVRNGTARTILIFGTLYLTIQVK